MFEFSASADDKAIVVLMICDSLENVPLKSPRCFSQQKADCNAYVWTAAKLGRTEVKTLHDTGVHITFTFEI